MREPEGSRVGAPSLCGHLMADTYKDWPLADPNTALGKALLVLHAFQADEPTVSFTEIRTRTGFPKSTLHRVLGDLIAVGLVSREKRGYRLGSKLFQLGMRVFRERNLVEAAVPSLEDLYERTHETVHLGILDDNDVVYLIKITGRRPDSSPSRLGGRMPANCTAIGKVLLAFSAPGSLRRTVDAGLRRRTGRSIVSAQMLARQVEQIRRTGVGFEYGESAPGVTCGAVPVFDAENAIVGAISLTGSLPGFRPERHVEALRAAAKGISTALGRRQQALETARILGTAERNC